VCYTARNRAALEKEAEARRHGRPYGSPGATGVASYLSDTACYPFHSGLFGWVMPTLRYAPTLCERSRATRRSSHSRLPLGAQVLGREADRLPWPRRGDVLPLSAALHVHGTRVRSLETTTSHWCMQERSHDRCFTANNSASSCPSSGCLSSCRSTVPVASRQRRAWAC
jgi:hypothetical protein